MRKKVISVLCLILILFNFIFTVSFADEAEDSSNSRSIEKQTLEGVEFETPKVDGIMKEIVDGKSSILDSKNLKYVKNSTHNASTSNSVAIGSVSFVIVNAMTTIFPKVLASIGEGDWEIFTVYKLVMGKYEFFNMNFYEVNTVNSKDQGLLDKIGIKSLGDSIRQKVMEFYGITRAFSLGISVIVLMYIAIRMAISTLEQDKVKYKNMLTAWVSSIVLLFFMHFIIIGYSYITQIALNLIEEIASNMGINNIEHGILAHIINESLGRNSGFHGIYYLIVLIIFFYYQCKFFIAYIHRFCEIAFLVTVAPLVTITYSIDKVGDNRAQAFGAWFKELSIKYSIQVVHAITYCALIALAGAIATKAELVGALFLFALDKAEKIFRNVLNVNDTNFEKAHVPFFDRHKGKRKLF